MSTIVNYTLNCVAGAIIVVTYVVNVSMMF